MLVGSDAAPAIADAPSPSLLLALPDVLIVEVLKHLVCQREYRAVCRTASVCTALGNAINAAWAESMVSALRGVPWRGLRPVQIMRKVVDKRERPPLPSSMPGDVRALVGTCWSPGPDDRPDFQTIASVLHAPRSPPPVPPATTGQGTTKPLA